MSTYNDEKYIDQAINSILMQTLKDWELILINDNSTDNTEHIILSKLKDDKRLRYIKNKKRFGVTKNIIRCISLAQTKFIARLDSDDYWTHKNKLKHQYNFMQKNKGVSMLGTWAQVVDKNNKKLYKISYPTDDQKIRSKILYENSFVTSSIFFRKPLQFKSTFLDPLNKFADDFNLVLFSGLKGNFSNLSKYYTAYRINPNGISQTNSIQQIHDTIRIARLYKNNYPGYFIASVMWRLRKYYPRWLKGENSMKIKQILKYYN